MIALACAAGSACSQRRRDTGRDTPYHLLDLCRPSDGRRARRDWRRRGAQLQRRLPPCVYDERSRLPVGLAVGAADQGPRACHSARGLTGRERDLRFRGPGTEGSNPAPSSAESSANPISWIMDTACLGRCPAAGESTLNPLRTQGRSRGYSAPISLQPKAMSEQNDDN